MGPTIEALTIYPAAWAALFQGLAKGIAYGLAIVASILVVVTALLGWLGGRPYVEQPIDILARGNAPRSLGSIVPALLSQRQTHATHRRPRPGCRRAA